MSAVLASNDAIVMEIVKSALATIGEEMGAAILRGGYSSIVKEGGDACSGIFDGKGRLVAQGDRASLMHLCSLRPTLAEVMKDFPPEEMKEGDVFLSNDPYRGGIHSNDVIVIRPVFKSSLGGTPASNGGTPAPRGERPVFFTGTLIHVADIGGLSAGGLPATATEMYHEGLVLPPLKFHDAGVPNPTLLTVLAANSRTPEKVLGDIRALVGGVNVGAMRLQGLIAKYGWERLEHILDALMDYSERRTRQEIERLKPGIYEGSFTIDDDGVETMETRPNGFTVRVKVKIEGTSFEADFTGTDKQARGAINASLSQSMSGVMFAMRCLIDPTIPMNEGCYRPIKVTFPRGTLVNPNPPAALNARMATVGAIIDAMLEAMSGAYPEKAVAASCNIHVFTPTGRDATGRTWTYIDTLNGGGGARASKDGVDVIGGPLIQASAGGVGQSSEAFEIEYPVLVESMQMWPDSGGIGKYRGGLGMKKEIRMLNDGMLTARIADRSIFPPRGLRGGSAGWGGSWVINHGREGEQALPPKCTNVMLRAGDVITAFASGGGGMGIGWQRDEALVVADVREGKVSVEAAREHYGVAVKLPTGHITSAAVDAAETKRLRDALSKPAAGATSEGKATAR